MAKTALELSTEEWQRYTLPPQVIKPETQARWEQAWQLIPKLAKLLREEFGAEEIKAFGSVVNAAYFSTESDIDLAAWGIPSEKYFAAALAINEFDSDFEVDLIDPTLCCLKLCEKIEEEGIEV